MSAITDEEYAKIEKILSENPCTLYWDGNDVLTDHMVKLYCKAKDADPSLKARDWLCDYLHELHWDHDTSDHIRQVLKDEDYSPEEIQDCLDDPDLCSNCLLDTDFAHFAKDDVNVRFEMISNYDCMNSVHFETCGFREPLQTYTTYFGDVLSLLHLDPAKLNDHLSGIRVAPWCEDELVLNDEPYVGHETFAEEILEQCCPAVLLTLCARIPFEDLDDERFLLPVGTPVGFYSSWQGGGSMFHCRLTRPMEIQVKKPGGNYPYWRLQVDVSDRYSMVECYGHFPD